VAAVVVRLLLALQTRMEPQAVQVAVVLISLVLAVRELPTKVLLVVPQQATVVQAVVVQE
jgi:hypothetical protein